MTAPTTWTADETGDLALALEQLIDTQAGRLVQARNLPKLFAGEQLQEAEAVLARRRGLLARLRAHEKRMAEGGR